MILGVDHIALSCPTIDAGLDALAPLGFKPVFVHRDLGNHEEKRPFLRNFDAGHGLAYCRGTSGIAVELTRHAAHDKDTPSPYQVLFDGQPPNAAPCDADTRFGDNDAWDAVADVTSVEAGAWPGIGARFWHAVSAPGSDGIAIRCVMLPVSDLAVSEPFWVAGLGCRQGERGRTPGGHAWSCVSFRSVVPAWCLDVLLVEIPLSRGVPHLDDAGFPCLALLTNRLQADKESVRVAGAGSIGNDFPMEVNGKSLAVCMLRGPCSELIELIQPPAKKGTC